MVLTTVWLTVLACAAPIQCHRHLVLITVRQGGLLSPCLFIRYIRDMICVVVKLNFACIIGAQTIVLLAYADDYDIDTVGWVT